jgi:type VI secretion system protein ImpH
VIQRLLDEPGRFEFFQTLRLLERLLERLSPDNASAGDGSLTAHLRFHNSTSMAFPPSEVAALWSRTPDNFEIRSDQQLLSSLLDDPHHAIHITPAGFGLLGVGGVMPFHYTEAIAAAERSGHDGGARAFIDVLGNRAALLFYQAWARYRIECQPESPDEHDSFLSLQLALAGHWPQASASPPDRLGDCLSVEAIACYAALFRQRPATADIIEGVLSEYFEVPVRVRQFVGDWYRRDDQTQLGVADCVLGGGAMLGERCHRSDLAAEVRIGPLTRRQYRRFLPGAPALRALTQMLALFSIATVRFRVRLVLRADEVDGCRLAASERRDSLGYGLFLGDDAVHQDRDDLCFGAGADHDAFERAQVAA